MGRYFATGGRSVFKKCVLKNQYCMMASHILLRIILPLIFQICWGVSCYSMVQFENTWFNMDGWLQMRMKHWGGAQRRALDMGGRSTDALL